MIRNVVVGRLREAEDDRQAQADRRQLRAGLDGIAALRLPGVLANHCGLDVELRAGGWDFAITNDWIDAPAYEAYDTDPVHNVFRAQIVEVCEQVARVQFEIAPGL
ncbi:Dabb family protein [Williamsia sp. MIQD14]|uniref:Dabb family protein n=1 Tax=Williamsia sp. MIQD14 TaxID=3425703 RepID=UPI003DA14D62